MQKQIKNPKLALLVPLSKVRYNRTIRYMGTDPISIPNPDGSISIYPKQDGDVLTRNIMEDYTMDYIVQPLDKSRNGIGIGLTYTAIDFPRFNLSKKKLGLTFNDNTVTTQDLSLYSNKPLDVPGSIHYLPWTNALAADFQVNGYVQSVAALDSVTAEEGAVYAVGPNQLLYEKQGNSWVQLGEVNKLTTWKPAPQDGKYPLSDAAIKKLVAQTEFSYGILATIYYWPVTETGRFEGRLYEKGGFITLSLYNTYEGSE